MRRNWILQKLYKNGGNMGWLVIQSYVLKRNVIFLI